MRLLKTLLLISLSAAVIFSCDYVANSKKPVTTVLNSSSSTTSPPAVVRKIMIEDYTGHKCGNCPAAARMLTSMESQSTYSGNIVPIAVHAGFYSQVTPTSNPPYPTNLTSQAGTDWDTFFGNSAFGNPNGLIDRAPSSDSSSFIKQYSSWGAAATAILALTPQFQLTINNTYNSSSNQVSTTVTAKALQSVSGTFNLTIVITEDSIYGEQEDYSMPVGQQYITNYLFNHVLRTSVNGSWGELVFSGSISANSTNTITHANFQLSSNWKTAHLHVIAFIYDAASTGSPTKNQVFQVETKTVL